MRNTPLPFALAALVLVAAPSPSSAEDKPIEQAEKLLKSGLFKDRLHGVEVLEGIGADKKVEKLLVATMQTDDDWGVQIRAAELLGRIGSEDARDALAQAAVEGEIQWVRDAAGRALGQLAGDAAGEMLLDRTKQTRDDVAKARAVDAAAPFVKQEHIARLVRYTREKDPYLARAGARALGRLAGLPDATGSAIKGLMPVLAKRKDHRSFLPYSGAIEGLAAADSPEARDILISEVVQFPDDDGYVAERVGRGLAAAGDEKASAALGPAIVRYAKKPEVGRLAHLVARAGAVSARPQVESLLSHKEERVRSEAVRALGILGGTESKDLVLATLDDSGPYVRVEAVTALARILTPQEFAALGERIRADSDMRVRLQFVVECYDAMDPVGLDPLMAYLDDPTWHVATAAAAAIGALGIDEDLPRLEPLLSHKDWKLRAAAYEGIARLRAEAAIPLLAEGLADRDPVVKGVCWTNLQILTMERLGGKSADWLAWWRENGSSVDIEKRSRKSAEEKEVERKTNERYASGSLTRDQGVEILQKARILVITGAWDKVERVLEHLSIKHTLLRAQELKLAGLNPNQILLINCEGNLDSDTMERVAWFVNVGGYVMTTDWALTKTIMPVFPGYATQFARSSTGNDVVVVEEGMPGHPLTAGVFDGVPALQWWLEVQAFPMTVLYPERVDVIVDSAEMRHRYGSTPLGIAFRWGLGKVQHSASHFYLQEEGMQHASKPRDRMVFAADNLGLSLDTIRKMSDSGAFDGRVTEDTLKQIAPDYSMFRMIVNMVREKSLWVENL